MKSLSRIRLFVEIIANAVCDADTEAGGIQIIESIPTGDEEATALETQVVEDKDAEAEEEAEEEAEDEE